MSLAHVADNKMSNLRALVIGLDTHALRRYCFDSGGGAVRETLRALLDGLAEMTDSTTYPENLRAMRAVWLWCGM